MSSLIRGLLPACALALLAGCAGAPEGVQWSSAPLRDQHVFLPQLLGDQMRPAVVVTSGPTGLVVGTGEAAPATRMVSQNGQLRLVSEATYARMQQQGETGTAMGAGPPPGQVVPATPAPAR